MPRFGEQCVVQCPGVRLCGVAIHSFNTVVNQAGKVPAKRELRAWGCGCSGRRLQGKLASVRTAWLLSEVGLHKGLLLEARWDTARCSCYHFSCLVPLHLILSWSFAQALLRLRK